LGCTQLLPPVLVMEQNAVKMWPCNVLLRQHVWMLLYQVNAVTRNNRKQQAASSKSRQQAAGSRQQQACSAATAAASGFTSELESHFQTSLQFD